VNLLENDGERSITWSEAEAGEENFAWFSASLSQSKAPGRFSPGACVIATPAQAGCVAKNE
jgi:hypothetical protein